jgi:hypothetical protein
LISGHGKDLPLGHCNRANRTIELRESEWPNRPGWKRVVAIAHEVFHVYQQEVIVRSKAGRRRSDDPTGTTTEGWSSYANPYDLEISDGFLRGRVSRLRFLEMLESYSDHPYERDAEAYGRKYLEGRPLPASN